MLARLQKGDEVSDLTDPLHRAPGLAEYVTVIQLRATSGQRHPSVQPTYFSDQGDASGRKLLRSRSRSQAVALLRTSIERGLAPRLTLEFSDTG